jgi:hypothetical protein
MGPLDTKGAFIPRVCLAWERGALRACILSGFRRTKRELQICVLKRAIERKEAEEKRKVKSLAVLLHAVRCEQTL